ncbi:MAG: hypothetical protein MJ252_02975 [archaeon]|nr:hypothetical protein [archaeon]
MNKEDQNISGSNKKENKNNDNPNNENDLQEINLQIQFDYNKIKEFNTKSVDLIFDDKIETAMEILKKIEIFLEGNAIESKMNLDKKMLIIILHNLACCQQKLKDYESCISYLDAVIYHFDSSLEPKHKIKINENYFLESIHQDQSDYPLLGDFILELRFSAKFHLQMSAVLSQASKHYDSLKHAKLAALMCEDNLVKTLFLYKQMIEKKDKFKNDKIKNKKDDEYSLFEDKIKQSYQIIYELYQRVLNIRSKNKLNKSNTETSFKPNNNLDSANKASNSKFSSFFNEATNIKFNSYSNYRDKEINDYKSDINLISTIRTVFGSKINKDDWIQLLNIGNIMYLSALNFEDLDLDSDPKYELLRDAILEKVVMLTISYFCIANELRFVTANKPKLKKFNGEFYHSKAIEFSSSFLPVSCPIVKYFILTYYKYYGNDLPVIKEGEVENINIQLVRSEIEEEKETLTFIKAKRMNYIIENNEQSRNGLMIPNLELNLNDKNSKREENTMDREYELLQKDKMLEKKTKLNDGKGPKFKLNFNKIFNEKEPLNERPIQKISPKQNNGLKQTGKKLSMNNLNRNGANGANKIDSEKVNKKYIPKTDRNKLSKPKIVSAKNQGYSSKYKNIKFNIPNQKGYMTERLKSSKITTKKTKEKIQPFGSYKERSQTQRNYKPSDKINKPNSVSKRDNISAKKTERNINSAKIRADNFFMNLKEQKKNGSATPGSSRGKNNMNNGLTKKVNGISPINGMVMPNNKIIITKSANLKPTSARKIQAFSPDYSKVKNQEKKQKFVDKMLLTKKNLERITKENAANKKKIISNNYDLLFKSIKKKK